MTILLIGTNMEQVFRTAFIGSASIVFGVAGYCLVSAIILVHGRLLMNTFMNRVSSLRCWASFSHSYKTSPLHANYFHAQCRRETLRPRDGRQVQQPGYDGSKPKRCRHPRPSLKRLRTCQSSIS